MLRFLVFVLFLGVTVDAPAQNWQLVWSDEFDTPGIPDPAKWGYDIGGHGWGNQELQYYTDRPENARIDNGVLIIEAHREDYEGNDYTSARLVTRGRVAWQYGRIEARIKMPQGQGIWPAFWMLPTDSPYGGWPAGGEIDIMEYLGHDTDRVYGTLHSGGGELDHRFTGTHYDLTSGTFAEEFHTFALEWEPRRMRWYVDGTLYQTQISWSSAGGSYPAPFDHPFHILLNLAVGGQWPGYPDASTVFPQRLEVDYVRVYEDVDAYPDVTLDAPGDGATVGSGGTVSLEATATDAGAVEEVIFLQDGGVLGVDEDPPYAVNVDGAADGCYELRARAIDEAGYVTDSEPASITVGTGCPPGNTSPYLMVPAILPGTVEAEYYDLGGPDVAYLDFSTTNEGSRIREDEGVDIRPSRDNGGGFDVTNIIAREWLAYTIRVSQSGTYRIVARAASGSGGTLRIAVDGDHLLGDVSISPTGGDVTYANALIGVVDLQSGIHTLRLDMRSAGFSLNRLTFSLIGATAAEERVDPDHLSLLIAPNPAADQTQIRFRIPIADEIDLALFDLLGRRVMTLESGHVAPGAHTVKADISALVSGVYTCVLQTRGGIRSASFAVIR